jgi:predicted outer membrane repeat protein
VGDACRLAAGSSDLNGNGIPDDCASEFVVGGSGYASIAEAIAIAPDGTFIDVAAGIYGPIDLSGRTLTLISLDGPTSAIIDGGNSDRPITITSAGTEPSVIEGFTIRNGHATSGGGALIVDATAYFSNCVWTANSATNDGGAVRIEGGSSVFLDCTFAGNNATNGGAMSIAAGTRAGTTTIDACTISDNTASELGGALYVTGSMELLGSTVEFNVANSGSAGVDVQDAISATISDTQLCANEPTNLLGAIAGSKNRFGRDCNANGLCDLDELNSTNDTDNDGTLDRCERALGDLNLDGVVNNYDLAAVLFYWGTANAGGDVNSDGSVTSTDLSILLSNWGPLD